MNLATLHEDLGRREDALAVYERILRLDPRSLEALARYSHLQIFETADDPLIARLQRAIASPGAGAAERASLGFALGRALDSCGAYAAAFGAYAAANRASRDSAATALASYDRMGAERDVDRLIQAFPAASAAVKPNEKSPQPIFICGMFRSGSTLIEQVLGGHPRVAAGGELDFVPHIAQQALAPFPESMMSVSPQRLAALAADYLASLATLFPGAEYVTDKRPDNFLYIGLIKRLFPNARIVHTTRDPLDNCLSIFFLHLDQRMSYALDLMDTGHHYRQYLRLMAHWQALYGADIHEVNYDAFVRTPQRVAREVLDFLGLEWDERCLAPPAAERAIKTSSVWQVREPVHRRSSGRSQHYALELRALADYLANPA
jgi:tetratricopeptide (TPR) repeat protein